MTPSTTDFVLETRCMRMESQNITTVPDIVYSDKALVPVMAHMACLAPAQLTNPMKVAVGAAFSGKCCFCCGSGYRCHDCRAGAKEERVAIITDAGVVALPTSSAIFVVSRDSATYQSEVLLGLEPVESLWREDSREQDYVIDEPKRETPRLFNTTLEVSAHNGKNLVLCIPVLIDTGQNIKEGILLSRDFCSKLRLISEFIPNSSVPLNCANPGSKINC